MKILINCSNLRVGGGLQVAHSFLDEISNGNSSHEYTVVVSSALNELIGYMTFPSNFKIYNYDISPSIYKVFTGKDKFLTAIEKENSIEAVFTVFGPSYWRPRKKHVCGFARAHYVYKNSPYFSLISNRNRLRLKLLTFVHMHDFRNNCDVLITENPDISDLLRVELNKPIFTVTNFYNQIFDDASIWSKDINLNLPNDVVKLLTISAYYPHKNLTVIKDTVRYLIRNHKDFKFKFVLTVEKEDLNFNDEEIESHIIFLGKINIYQCPTLYEQCDFLFLPTLLECFSASYCEAMKMKVPILTSDLSFAKAICGDAAIYFSPLDPVDIGEKIWLLSTNRQSQKRLVENGVKQLNNFDSSKKRAIKYLEIIEKKWFP